MTLSLCSDACRALQIHVNLFQGEGRLPLNKVLHYLKRVFLFTNQHTRSNLFRSWQSQNKATALNLNKLVLLCINHDKCRAFTLSIMIFQEQITQVQNIMTRMTVINYTKHSHDTPHHLAPLWNNWLRHLFYQSRICLKLLESHKDPLKQPMGFQIEKNSIIITQ